MPDSVDMLAVRNDYSRFHAIGSMLARRDFLDQGSFNPGRQAVAFESGIVTSSGVSPFPAQEKTIREVSKPSYDGIKLASLFISVSAFIAWLALMLTVVSESESILNIAMATMIPFFAHVANVWLMVSHPASERRA